MRAFAWSVEPAPRSPMLRLTDVFRFTAPPPVLEECFISLRQPALGEGAVTWIGGCGTVTVYFELEQFEPHLDAIRTHSLSHA